MPIESMVDLDPVVRKGALNLIREGASEAEAIAKATADFAAARSKAREARAEFKVQRADSGKPKKKSAAKSSSKK